MLLACSRSVITLDGPRSTNLEAQVSASGRNRRIHPRVSSDDLSTPVSIRFPNSPAVTLVDLSPGGALLHLPFQVRPDARVTVEFRAASERMMLPFRWLRSYVRSLKGGVHYEAAGEFVHGLDWKPLLADVAAQTTSNRLIATLEAFLRHASTTGRILEFDQLLMWVLDAARRGERGDRVAVEIRLRLRESFRPSSSSRRPRQVWPTLPGARDSSDSISSASVRSPRPIAVSCGQQRNCSQSSMAGATYHERRASRSTSMRARRQSSDLISYSIADWQEMRQAEGAARSAPWKQSA